MPAPEIAVAYVSIVPSIQGFAGDLRRQVTGSAGDAGNRAGEGFASNFKAKALAGAAIAGAAIGKALTDAIDQANVKSTLQAQLGATGKDADRYGKIAGKLYTKGITDNFQEGADAIKAVVSAGLAPPDATNKQLQGIAQKATDVSKVFGQDLGGVTNAVAQMVKTGLAKNSTEAFDIITRGFQTGADKGGDFLDTINEYSTQFRKVGLDGSTSLGLINQALQNGARDSDIAADAIKEFSIRAVDGSDTTAAGFKALGLNADDMAAKFGKGGKTAATALDTTFDRLRGIKDPIKRSQAAVALFGTQAEDLGDALYAMDPSKAVDTIGKVGGSAQRLGKTIHSGPTHELEVFIRTIKQKFTDAVASVGIPAILGLADAVKEVAKWAGSAWDWIADVSPWLAPFAVLVTGLAVAINAQAIASGISTAITWAQVTALSVAAGATGLLSTAMGILNTIMALNPIVLVVVALLALGTAFYVAWQKSETFRDIVKAVWGAIVDAAITAKDAILDALSWIGDKASSLWNDYIKPFFTSIGDAFKAVGRGAKSMYDHYIKPAFDAAGMFVSNWWTGIKRIFGAVKDGMLAVGRSAKNLYNSYVKPAFGWIGDKVKAVWNSGVQPVFSAMKTGVKKVAEGFDAARKAIYTAWHKVEGIAKAPIKFVINTVYNKGIVGVWNKVATAFGASPLNEFHPKGFATGGILPGYTPGRDVHLAALSGGEAIMRPEWTRAMGPGYVHGMNALARKGGVRAIQRLMGGGLPAFKDGGIFGWIDSAGSAIKGVGSAAWDKVKKATGWIKDGVEASARAGVKHVVEPLIGLIPGTDHGFGRMIKKLPMRMIDALFGYSKKADGKMTDHYAKYAGGGNLGMWIAKAMNLAKVPANWAGPLRTLIMRESGGNPNAINNWDSNAKRGDPSRGLMQTIGATFQHYRLKSLPNNIYDPIANIVAGIRYIKAVYGSIFNVQQANAGKTPKGYDSGGWLMPGATQTVNKTGKPEAVFTAEQWSSIHALAARGGGLQDGARIVLVTDRGQFEAYIDSRADGRIKTTLADPAHLGRAM